MCAPEMTSTRTVVTSPCSCVFKSRASVTLFKLRAWMPPAPAVEPC